MRVLVCGGRDYNNRGFLYRKMDLLHAKRRILLLIDGAQRGADTLGHEWAVSRGIPTVREPANWNLHGNFAGPIRNRVMRDKHKPDLVVAFSGRTGTANMIALAHEKHIPVWDLRPG